MMVQNLINRVSGNKGKYCVINKYIYDPDMDHIIRDRVPDFIKALKDATHSLK